jgi:hypothetical protein
MYEVEIGGSLGLRVDPAPMRSPFVRHSSHCTTLQVWQAASNFVGLGYPKFRGGGTPLGRIGKNGIIYVSLPMHTIPTEFFPFDVHMSPLSAPKFSFG